MECKHLVNNWEQGTVLVPHYECKKVNCTELYNFNVDCPIRHLLYNCSYIDFDFETDGTGEIVKDEPMSYHCTHPDVLKKGWECPVKNDGSVKCPLRAKGGNSV